MWPCSEDGKIDLDEFKEILADACPEDKGAMLLFVAVLFKLSYVTVVVLCSCVLLLLVVLGLDHVSSWVSRPTMGFD